MMMEEKTGEWSHMPSQRILNFGRPFAPSTRIGRMTSLRIFFQDLQQWEVISRRFDPYRAFRSPLSLRCLLERNPRVLADDIWAKLIWAGLNIVDTDLRGQGGHGGRSHLYPFTFVRAVIVVWLFARLRWDEIRRLRLGCVRWQEDASGERVCLLSIPVNKTSTAFTKPIDKLAGEAIEAWEKERPIQAKLLELKTGQQVDYLFLHRMRLMGDSYLNKILIPALCKKAGLSCVDVRGRITSHRA
jgi:integrase